MEQNKKFALGVERLINPITVGTMHFLQGLNSLLPRKIQNKMMNSTSVKVPYMGFVVEPYSTFLCYEIADIEAAKALLPDNFELVKTSIFDNDEPKYYCIFGCINVHTSAFWGSRVEFYIIAEDTRTNLLSWIIVDYDTNTISYDKKSGLRAPNSPTAVITTNHRGRLFADILNSKDSRHLAFEYTLTEGKMTPLAQRLWLEGNLSIGYGKILSENEADIFSLKFEPCEVEKALFIDPAQVTVNANTWFPGLFHEKPAVVACFPYAQHFVSDTPGHASLLKDEKELEEAVKNIDFSKISSFSVEFLLPMFIGGMILSLLTTIVLVALLIFT